MAPASDTKGSSHPGGPDHEFVSATEPFRKELLTHCYRMLGSVHDAEDQVQETYLRAWRSYSTFEGRASVRVWLHHIATNACLTALERRGRRTLPSRLGPASIDPDGPPVLALDREWLEPFPDALLSSRRDDPATIAEARANVRLALIASLQHLPPRQRAVLLLRDVLAFPAADVAGALKMSIPAVKSALQRARTRLNEVAPEPNQMSEPDDPATRALLDRYMRAFEEADMHALEQVLRTDATLEMTPVLTWFAGRQTCMRYLRNVIGTPGLWRMIPTRANGQPAAAAYRRDGDGVYAPFAIVVLTTALDQITGIALFGDPSVFTQFDLPDPNTHHQGQPVDPQEAPLGPHQLP
jgi:RNA polymerase sigma-70 factor (ECF subfamily)